MPHCLPVPVQITSSVGALQLPFPYPTHIAIGLKMSEIKKDSDCPDNQSPNQLVARAQVRLLRLIAHRAVKYVDENELATDKPEETVHPPTSSPRTGRTGS